VVVDGRSRLQAAREAGIPEIPVEEKEFTALEEAKLYASRRQAERPAADGGRTVFIAYILENKPES
jgi:hypothetical protein